MLQQSSWTLMHLILHSSAIFWAACPQERPTLGQILLKSRYACRDSDIAEDIQPESVQPLGNYAVQITWQDGFNQVRLGLLPAIAPLSGNPSNFSL